MINSTRPLSLSELVHNMKYTPLQRKLVLEILEDRHAPGVLFDFAPPFAPDASDHKSSFRRDAFHPSIDSLRHISISGLDSSAKVPAKSVVAQQKPEPRREEAVSSLGFSLTELNDVLNGSLNLSKINQVSTGIRQQASFTNSQSTTVYDHEGDFQNATGVKGKQYENIQSYRSLHSSDGLFSILTSTSKMPSSQKGDDPAPNWGQTEYGNIRIDCTTNLASGGNPEGILGDNAKLIPGWFSNVNWSADWNNKNGWDPATTKTTTATNSAIYTPDKEKVVVAGGIAGGDPDLRKFVVKVIAHNNTGNHNWDFKLTFENTVRVYKNINTKAESPITSGTVFTPTDGNHITKTMTFYLEGITASSTFGDVQLSVDYVGGNIPMLCTFDTVNVTVFGVTQDGFFSGNQQPDNKAKHVMYDASFNENGQISWDSAYYIGLKAITNIDYCQYIRDCMEVQGTVFPPRESNPSQFYGNSWDPSDPEPYPPNPVQAKVTFGMTREKIKVTWKILNGTNQWVADPTPIEWVPDHGQGGLNDGIANIVTNTSHIYCVDSPGLSSKNINQLGFGYYAKYINFRNAVNVKIYGDNYQCSDYYRWHSVIKVKPSPDNITITRARNEVLSFGEHWAAFPTAAPTDHGTW